MLISGIDNHLRKIDISDEFIMCLCQIIAAPAPVILRIIFQSHGLLCLASLQSVPSRRDELIQERTQAIFEVGFESSDIGLASERVVDEPLDRVDSAERGNKLGIGKRIVGVFDIRLIVWIRE